MQALQTETRQRQRQLVLRPRAPENLDWVHEHKNLFLQLALMGQCPVSPELPIIVVLITIKGCPNPSKELRLRIVALQTTKRGGDPRFTKKWLAKLQATNPHACFFPSSLAQSSSPICSSALCDMRVVLPAVGESFVTYWSLTATRSGKSCCNDARKRMSLLAARLCFRFWPFFPNRSPFSKLVPPLVFA